MRQWVSRVLALLLMSGLGLVVGPGASAASTGQCHWVNTPVKARGTAGVQYKRTRVCPAGVTPGAQPVVVKGAPSCDIKSAPPATFCWG